MNQQVLTALKITIEITSINDANEVSIEDVKHTIKRFFQMKSVSKVSINGVPLDFNYKDMKIE